MESPLHNIQISSFSVGEQLVTSNGSYLINNHSCFYLQLHISLEESTRAYTCFNQKDNIFNLTFPNTKQYKVTPIAHISAAFPLYLSFVATQC